MKSDLDLMKAFRQGDTTAFLKLVRRHHLNVFNFLRALVNVDGLAEPLTHETFLRMGVERSTPSNAQTLGFGLVLLRIASACWLDYNRRNVPLDATRLATSKHTAAATNASSRVSAARPPDVQSLFHQLPPELKVVLALSSAAGLSYNEISQVLEIPLDSVKNRMNEGYGRMRALLQPIERQVES